MPPLPLGVNGSCKPAAKRSGPSCLLPGVEGGALSRVPGELGEGEGSQGVQLCKASSWECGPGPGQGVLPVSMGSVLRTCGGRGKPPLFSLKQTMIPLLSTAPRLS